MSDMSHNHQKKIAVINDMSGFGRCSIAVELPVISAMKVQCCPLPTSIFSNHTGFESFFFDDYTDKMEDYMQEWVKLGLQFNGHLHGLFRLGTSDTDCGAFSVTVSDKRQHYHYRSGDGRLRKNVSDLYAGNL